MLGPLRAAGLSPLFSSSHSSSQGGHGGSHRPSLAARRERERVEPLLGRLRAAGLSPLFLRDSGCRFWCRPAHCGAATGTVAETVSKLRVANSRGVPRLLTTFPAVGKQNRDSSCNAVGGFPAATQIGDSPAATLWGGFQLQRSGGIPSCNAVGGFPAATQWGDSQLQYYTR